MLTSRYPGTLCRLGEGGCTAMLGPTGTFLDCAAVGHPQFCAPEVLRALRGSQVQYAPPGGHASLSSRVMRYGAALFEQCFLRHRALLLACSLLSQGFTPG